MAVVAHEVTVSRDLSEFFEPRPAECLACFIRRALVSGCSGTLGLAQCWESSTQGNGILAGWLFRQGAQCDCEVVTTLFEPCIFQIRTDDGRYIPPRALAEVCRCFGVNDAVTKPCAMWSRVIPHPGPPWR